MDNTQSLHLILKFFQQERYAELPVSMYTTKTPIDKCRFNVTQLNYFFPFSVKDRYQLNYFYQRLQCTDHVNSDHVPSFSCHDV
jgi:hypothetical protein